MSIVKELRKQWIVARKLKSSAVPFYAFVISEIEMIGKNDKNRETTNDEAVRVLQKLITANDVNIELGSNVEAATEENKIMSELLPKMLTEEEIYNAIAGSGLTNIGAIMGFMKKTYGASVDMKYASKVAKEFVK